MQWFIDNLGSLSPSAIYAAVTGILLICGLGVPLPEDVPLITSGYLAHKGLVNVHVIFACTFAAVLGGDSIAFFLGRRFGQRLLAWPFAHRFMPPRKQRRIRAYFRKLGSKVVFAGRFMPGFRGAVFFVAGMMRLRFTTFLMYDGLAAMLSVPFLVYCAYYFGEHIDSVIIWARKSEHGVLALIGAVVAIIVIKSLLRRRKNRAAAGDTAPTS